MPEESFENHVEELRKEARKYEIPPTDKGNPAGFLGVNHNSRGVNTKRVGDSSCAVAWHEARFWNKAHSASSFEMRGFV